MEENDQNITSKEAVENLGEPGASGSRAKRRGKAGNPGSAKTYSYASIQKLKEEWRRIGAGAVLEDTIYAKRAIRIAAKDMADTILDVTMDRSEYVQSLVRGGFHRSTAFEIVKIAFAMATEVQEIAMRKNPSAHAKAASSRPKATGAAMTRSPPAGGAGNREKEEDLPVAWSDPCGNWSDYVLSLPDALPRPRRTWEPEHDINIKKKISLKTVRPDLFGDEFDKSLNGLVKGVAGNALGRFNPNPIIGKYPGVWSGIGHFDVPDTVLAECLPYLAEEGLLEFHKVPLSVVRELEEMRQVGIDQGRIPAYDWNVRPNQKKET